MTKILDEKGVVIELENHTPVAATVQSVVTPNSSLTTSEILRSRIVDSGLTMKQAFLKFDRNGSGSIEREEMKEVLKQFQIPFTVKSLEDLFERYDVNRDNKFQYGEFVRIIQAK
jgi:Ca2+-binding EF-hand superfamily protein